MATKNTQSWQQAAESARQYCENTITRVEPPVPGVPNALPLNVTRIPNELLSPREVLITELPPERLLEELSSGRLRSVEVTTAYLRRAGIAHRLTNCVTELIDNYAIMRAQELDDYFEKHKKPMGPFHGLPISLTGNIAMNTLPLNLGYAGWWGRCGEVDAQILRPMYKLGCLYYVRTTQPLTLIAPEVESNLYGRTLNPFDTRLNATGTSGGEGSLMAMGASSVGVAVDLGTGGIGVTAASSGTYGLRPTCGRLPNFMLVSSLRQDGLPVVPGPISTSLEGISLYMKGVMGTEPWTKDHSLSPLPWIESTSPSASLKIGYLVDDGMVTPDSSIVRAVNLMLQELGRIPGVQLVEWKPVAHEEALKLTSRLLAADGAKDRLEAIESSDEPLLESTKLALKDARESHPLDLEGFAALLRERDNYRFRYGRAWRDTCTEKARDSRVTGTIDVLLCPAGSSVGTLKNQPHYAGYNSVWSLLDYPTLTFSVMRADANADTSSGKSADASTNLPIALQLVARRNQDEKLVETLRFIQQHISLPFPAGTTLTDD